MTRVAIRQALFDLGYDDVYHFTSIAQENPKDAEMWVDALKGKYEGGKPFTRNEWDQLLGHCMAVTDMPGCFFASELVSAYPDAKVILLVRDSVDAWYDSFMNTVQGVIREVFLRQDVGAKILRLFLPHRTSDDMLALLVKHTPLGRIETEGKQWYAQHNREIRELAADRQFLEFNVKQGWAPLCDFLGKEQPDEPFPRVNDREEFKRGVQVLQRIKGKGAVTNMAKFATSIVAAGLAIWIGWSRTR